MDESSQFPENNRAKINLKLLKDLNNHSWLIDKNEDNVSQKKTRKRQSLTGVNESPRKKKLCLKVSLPIDCYSRTMQHQTNSQNRIESPQPPVPTGPLLRPPVLTNTTSLRMVRHPVPTSKVRTPSVDILEQIVRFPQPIRSHGLVRLNQNNLQNPPLLATEAEKNKPEKAEFISHPRANESLISIKHKLPLAVMASKGTYSISNPINKKNLKKTSKLTQTEKVFIISEEEVKILQAVKSNNITEDDFKILEEIKNSGITKEELQKLLEDVRKQKESNNDSDCTVIELDSNSEEVNDDVIMDTVLKHSNHNKNLLLAALETRNLVKAAQANTVPISPTAALPEGSSAAATEHQILSHPNSPVPQTAEILNTISSAAAAPLDPVPLSITSFPKSAVFNKVIKSVPVLTSIETPLQCGMLFPRAFVSDEMLSSVPTVSTSTAIETSSRCGTPFTRADACNELLSSTPPHSTLAAVNIPRDQKSPLPRVIASDETLSSTSATRTPTTIEIPCGHKNLLPKAIACDQTRTSAPATRTSITIDTPRRPGTQFPKTVHYDETLSSTPAARIPTTVETPRRSRTPFPTAIASDEMLSSASLDRTHTPVEITCCQRNLNPRAVACHETVCSAPSARALITVDTQRRPGTPFPRAVAYNDMVRSAPEARTPNAVETSRRPGTPFPRAVTYDEIARSVPDTRTLTAVQIPPPTTAAPSYEVQQSMVAALQNLGFCLSSYSLKPTQTDLNNQYTQTEDENTNKCANNIITYEQNNFQHPPVVTTLPTQEQQQNVPVLQQQELRMFEFPPPNIPPPHIPQTQSPLYDSPGHHQRLSHTYTSRVPRSYDQRAQHAQMRHFPYPYEQNRIPTLSTPQQPLSSPPQLFINDTRRQNQMLMSNNQLYSRVMSTEEANMRGTRRAQQAARQAAQQATQHAGQHNFQRPGFTYHNYYSNYWPDRR